MSGALTPLRKGPNMGHAQSPPDILPLGTVGYGTTNALTAGQDGGVPNMGYITVFDITQSGFRGWWVPAFGMLFVLIGVSLVKKRARKHRGKVLASIYLGLSILWTGTVCTVLVSNHFKLTSALREGRCQVAEGTVTEFHAVDEKREWFVVNGTRFEYSDFSVGSGFNNMAMYGGPIHEGLHVRIHHLGNDIVKLEVAR
jgi:hypothetical protein